MTIVNDIKSRKTYKVWISFCNINYIFSRLYFYIHILTNLISKSYKIILRLLVEEPKLVQKGNLAL